MTSSPTQRTLALLRKEGWTAEVVERFNPHANIRVDLFGCIDIVAIREGAILGVQATSASNLSKRVHKLEASEKAALWLRAGGRLETWGWARYKKREDGRWWRETRREMALPTSASPGPAVARR